MLQTRKNVLDKARTELADSINASNQVYNNEELSTIVQNQKLQIEEQQKQIEELKQNSMKWETEYSDKINNLYNDSIIGKKRNFNVSKLLKTATYNPTNILISNIHGPTMVEVKIFGNFNWINYGGYVEYKLAAHLESSVLHGLGAKIDRQGDLGATITSITPTYTNEQQLKLGLNFDASKISTNGSNIFVFINVISEYGVDKVSVSIE